MYCPLSGTLRDLLAATEAIRDDQGFLRGIPNSWQQDSFGHCLRHCKLVFLESERPGHSATSGIQRLHFCAQLPQQPFFMVHFHQRFLVAVAMEQDFHRALGWRIVWGVSQQKLAEQKCLASEPVGALVGGKQVMQLIPKYRSATRLQDNNWQSCVNRGS